MSKAEEAIIKSALESVVFGLGSQDGVEEKHWTCYHQHLWNDFTDEELDEAYTLLKLKYRDE